MRSIKKINYNQNNDLKYLPEDMYDEEVEIDEEKTEIFESGDNNKPLEYFTE